MAITFHMALVHVRRAKNEEIKQEKAKKAAARVRIYPRLPTHSLTSPAGTHPMHARHTCRLERGSKQDRRYWLMGAGAYNGGHVSQEAQKKGQEAADAEKKKKQEEVEKKRAANVGAKEAMGSSKYSKKDVDELKKVFDEYDKDGSGEITVGEFKSELRRRKENAKPKAGMKVLRAREAAPSPCCASVPAPPHAHCSAAVARCPITRNLAC